MLRPVQGSPSHPEGADLAWPPSSVPSPSAVTWGSPRTHHITEMAAFQTQGQNVGQERGKRAPHPPNQKPGRERGPGDFPLPSKGPLSLLLTYACHHHSLRVYELLPPTWTVQPPHYPQGVQATHVQVLRLRARSCATGRDGDRGSQSHRGEGGALSEAALR